MQIRVGSLKITPGKPPDLYGTIPKTKIRPYFWVPQRPMLEDYCFTIGNRRESGFFLDSPRGLLVRGKLAVSFTLPENNTENGWLEYVLVSSWDGLFSGAKLVLGSAFFPSKRYSPCCFCF